MNFILSVIFFQTIILCTVSGQPKFETLPLRIDLAIERAKRFQSSNVDTPAIDLKTIENLRFRSNVFPLKEQSDQCQRDLDTLFNATMKREFWAMKIIDAWGKPLPADILNGNLFWLGSYDECINRFYNLTAKTYVDQPINTQYCALFQERLNDDDIRGSGFILGLCLPSSCSRTMIATLLNDLFRSFNFTETSLSCSNGKPPLSNGAMAFLVVVGVLVGIVLLGTFIDILRRITCKRRHMRNVVNKHYQDLDDVLLLTEARVQSAKLEFLIEFSALRTLSHIFTTDDKKNVKNLPFLNGIRVLSLFWVVLGHSFGFRLSFTSNLIDLLAESKNIAFQLITSGTFSVDTFFVLSGFLTAILFMREVARKRFSLKLLFLYYIHRYIRLTPCFILVMFLSIYLTPYFGQGPIYPNQQGFEPAGCRQGNWWTAFAYVGNFIRPDDICLGVTWYLYNDMQFHWIAPLALIPFVYRRKLIGYLISFGFVLTSSGSILGLLLYYPSLVTHALDTTNTTGPNFFDLIYIKPWCRIAPYAIGLMTGLFVSDVDRNFRFNPMLRILGGLVSIGLGLGCIFGLYGDYYFPEGLSRTVLIIYQTLSRTVWSIAIAWLLIICSTHQGGFINRILSFSFWSPLARLNYSAYLIHATIIFLVLLNRTNAPYYQPMIYVGDFVYFLVLSYLAAIFVNIFFEAPFFVIEKKIFKR